MWRPLLFSTMLLTVPVGNVVAATTHSADAVTDRVGNSKTSDRTPNNSSPARTPGATYTGAAGTEVAGLPSAPPTALPAITTDRTRTDARTCARRMVDRPPQET
jgi:hypothetical protein